MGKLYLATITLLLTAASGANAQKIGHTWFMRGQVVNVDQDGVVICTGSRQGAQVGQTLNVMRGEMVQTQGAKAGISYRVRNVGSVKVEAIVDEHFARASIVKGDVKKSDMVTLERP